MPNYVNSQACNCLNPTFVQSELEKDSYGKRKIFMFFRFWNYSESCFNMQPSQVMIILHVCHEKKNIYFLLLYFFFLLFTFCFCPLCSLSSLLFFLALYYLTRVWFVFVFKMKAYNKTCFNSFNLYWTERKEGEGEVVGILTFI